MADFEKLIGLAVQTWGNLKDAMQRVRVRMRRIEQLQSQGGELGSLFSWSYIYPQFFYRYLLTCTAIAGLLAIIGGLLSAFRSPTFSPLQHLFESYWMTILAIGLLLWLVAGVDGLSRVLVMAGNILPTWMKPEAIDSPDWFNVQQFSDVFEDPQPLVLRQEGVDAAADIAINRLISDRYKSDTFAEKPFGLSDAERGNVAFFGCLLEHEHNTRKWKYRNWRPFYAVLSQASIGGTSIFAPSFIEASREGARDYYGIIRDCVNKGLIDAGQDPLPDAPIVAQDVQESAGVLIRSYAASAAELPTLNGQRGDLKVAFDRLEDFPHINTPGMGPQFLKLAVRWDVWPGIATGNFIFPFSKSLATFLLDEGALITLDTVNAISFSSADQQAVVREAMRQIVCAVKLRLETVNRPDYKALLEKLSAEATHPVDWDLAQYTDYILWDEANTKNKKKAFSRWRLDQEKGVTRQQNSGVV